LAIVIAQLSLAQGSPLLSTSYTPPRKSGTVLFFLEDVSKRTGVQLSYSDELVKRRRRVQLRGSERTVEDVLLTVLAGTGVHAVERSGKVLLIPDDANAAPAEQRYTLSGFVRDSASKEVLIGATVYIPALNTGTTTNTYGYYNLSVPAGTHKVIVMSLGYRADTTQLNLRSDLRRDVLLPYGLLLQGVTVSSQKEAPADHAHLTAKDISLHAGLLGENDVMHALQSQPGVQCGADGTGSVMVRGGDPGQNLNLLDGVPLYYIDHFYGITSVFNTDAVKSVDFYKGAFPARYGGRLSSIIDVASKDGNMERFGGQASLGLLKGNLTLEGPIVKDKASMMVAARRTWVDGLWRSFTDELGLDFYDINAKANYVINNRNRVYASFYTGRDQFRIGSGNDLLRALWGNSIGAVRWTSVVNPKLFIHTTATYSYFRFQVTTTDPSGIPDTTGKYAQYTGKATIRDIALRLQADYLLSSKHRLQFGALYANAGFAPASVSFANTSNKISAASFQSNEAAVYAEDEWKPSARWLLRGGLHLTTWINENYKYTSLQPRIYASCQLNGKNSLFGSITKMSQFLHLLNSNTSFAPADFWIPSTSNILPERSWLCAVGYTNKSIRNTILSAELYYKSMDNVVSYKNGNSIFENSTYWEESLTQGKGWAYGAELSGRMKKGAFTTSIAYTLSWSWRSFQQLNAEDAFPYRYDRRHNIRTEVVFQRRARFNAIASWTYMSGEALTLPDQLYPDFDNNTQPGQTAGGGFTYNYAKLNGYRLPAIHRLDVACNFMRSRGKHFESMWTLGLFNVYGRRNILAVSIQDEANGQYTLQGLSLFRFIPTISYSVKF
jgi:hypothetical protein